MKDLINPLKRTSTVSKKLPCGKLWVLTGNLRGKVFNLFPDERITIGRDQSCNIHIIDQKASRTHAELIFHNNELVVTDLKSHNGVLVNDQRILQSSVSSGSRLVIGQTVFKFEEIKQQNLKQQFEREYIAPEKSFISKHAIAILGVCFIFLILFWSVDEVDPPGKIKTGSSRTESRKISSLNNLKNFDLISKIQKQKERKDKRVNKRSHAFVLSGMRELREGNFFRALEEFDKALDISPKSTQAAYYRRKALELLDETIQKYRIHAKRDIASIKYKSALVSYCAIIRLLDSHKKDKRYKKTVKDINYIQGVLGYEDGEVQCFKR